MPLTVLSLHLISLFSRSRLWVTRSGCIVTEFNIGRIVCTNTACRKKKKKVIKLQSSVNPAFTTTSEQWPPVNNSPFDSSATSLNLTFIRPLFQTANFFRSQGWSLYTDLTAVKNQGKCNCFLQFILKMK